MQSQNEIKERNKDSPRTVPLSWEIFFFEVFLFSLTLIVGIATAFKLNRILEIEKITLTSISFWQFIFYFLLATLLIVILTYLKKFKREKGFIFKILFVFLTFWGGAITLSLWIGPIFALILIIVLIFGWLKFSSIFFHDLLIILGIVGIGSTLGLSLNPQIIIALLIFFSIYDFIAVYKTKHMIKMAKEMIEAQAPIALICPQKILDFKSSLKKVRPGGKFLILGGGDVAFPLLFCVSLIPAGIVDSIIVALFSLIGLSLSFLLFTVQKVRQPIPALPPIALFSILGYLFSLII